MQEGHATWEDCLVFLRDKVRPQSFQTWLRPTRLLEVDEQKVKIGVPNRFVASWLQTHYLQHLQEAIQHIFGRPLDIGFAVDDEVGQIVASESPPTPAPNNHRQRQSNLNSNYTFDNFVVGDSNQMAHAAALAVAESPANNKFNPLYIYGGVGLGKTHLAQAIGNFVLQANANLAVLYVTSETFTNDFINALVTQKTGEFAAYYRNVDVLLIDDIQFLTGKEATQVQFFHTFNALQQAGSQIVMTSDRPPDEIYGLEERLLSRFQCGLVADIQPPDYELRLAILNRRIREENLPIAPEVARCIADRISANIRQLNGFLHRLSAYHSFTRRPITVELVNELLAKNTNLQEISFDLIAKAVAAHFNVSIDSLRGKNKTYEVAMARQIAMYVARRYTDHSLKAIGSYFGGRDHSTVIHSVAKVEDLVEHDQVWKHRLDEVLKRIRALQLNGR